MSALGRRSISSTKESELVGQRKHRPDYVLVVLMGILMLFGLVLMYAIGPQRANILNSSYATDFYNETYFVVKQVISLTLSVVAFVGMSVIPFRLLKGMSERILWVSFGLCVLLLFFGNLLHIDAIAQCTLGACRWFNLGPLGGFQPSELLKFGLLIYMASFLGVRHKQGLINDREKTLIPVLLVVALAMVFVVVIQKDMGTGIAMASIVASILVVSGLNKKNGLQLIGLALAAGVALIIVAPHRVERVMTFLQGDNASHAEADDAHYHILNAKIALGSGGLLGLGIGNSVQATGYLPEAINDSVFAIIGETFGFVGTVFVLAVFTAFLMRILRVADRLPDMSMRLAVAGIFGWLGAHVVLNVASMIGVFPLTGITLPLLSFGGTSMVFIAAAIGLVFQLSGYTSHKTVLVKEAQGANTSSRRGEWRSRNSGRRGY